MIEPAHPDISVYRQCELLGLSKAAYYYKARGENILNRTIMRLIDEQYTRTPFYGVPNMTAWLKRQGYAVNTKRVRRLLRLLGLEAVYPKPWISKPEKGYKKHPYLLKDLDINRPNHVWCADITYIRLNQGFIYLVAVMDWFSRYVCCWNQTKYHVYGFNATLVCGGALAGHTDIIQILLAKGAKVDAKEPQLGMTALIAAASTGQHADTVKALLAAGLKARQKKTP